MKILPINSYLYNSTNNIVSKTRFAEVTEPLPADSVSFSGAKNTQVQKIIILLGAPNSGKGTCAKKIAQKYSIPQISLGDILRNETKLGTALGLEAKKYMSSGGLVPDEIILKVLGSRILKDDCKNGFILDGFPRTINQAEKFDEILKGLKNAELKIINLDVDKDILYARSAHRYTCPECSNIYSLQDYNPETSRCECGAKLIKRADDTPEILTKRLENYEKQTMPLINYYGDKVLNVGIYGTDAPPEETFTRVVEKLEK
jgi:adenylate kinase